MRGPLYEIASVYRYGYQAQERDDEVYGRGASHYYRYRQHDARLGWFWSVDPLARKYPWNSPYAFAENRLVDGVEWEGLEYVRIVHYPDGSRVVTSYYTMRDDEVKALGGKGRSLFSVAPHGPRGKGVLHVHKKEDGRVSEVWEMRKNLIANFFAHHGLYSGPGSVTISGEEKAKDWDFSYRPMDWADAIAKLHDIEYDEVANRDGYKGFVEDVRTLDADKAMVERIKEVLKAKREGRSVSLEGVETPVYTDFTLGTVLELHAQRFMIGSLARYKAWKVKKGLEGEGFGSIGWRFMLRNPVAGIGVALASMGSEKKNKED